MIQLNLLPDIKRDFIKAQQTKSFVISVAIIATVAEVGISALLFVYVTFVQQLQVNLLDSDIKNKTVELQNIDDIEKYLTVQNQLASVTELHDQKGVFSRLMNFLPVLNPNAPYNVVLSNMQADAETQTITLTGSTASFQGLNVFVDTLRNAEADLKEPGSTKTSTVKMFKEVSVQSGGLGRVDGKELVTFMVQVNYNEVVFDYKSADVLPIIPNIKTSQSVTNSPSVQLFDQNTEGN